MIAMDRSTRRGNRRARATVQSGFPATSSHLPASSPALSWRPRVL